MPDLTIGGILTSVIALLLGTGLLVLIDRVWRNNPVRRRWDRRRAGNDARRLLNEFQRRANGNLRYTIAIDKAAARAGVDDPGPAVELLKELELVEGTEQGTRPIYVRLTAKGLQDAENAG